jgi:tether containing UBX domain for GLUT4
MGRELSSFSDLQKSLAQLGFKSGNVLFRLSFRTTQEPLEEAMVKITQYFKENEEDAGAPSTAAATNTNVPKPAPTAVVEETEESINEAVSSTPPEPPTESLPSEEQATKLSASGRPITVFRPPTGSTPQSALASYHEEDYIPSIEHAKSHQGRLNQLSQNVRLPSDKEIAEKAAAAEEKLAGIKEIEIKIRFPEQSQVLAKFNQSDTGATLYSFVRDCLETSFRGEKFSLVIWGPGQRRGSVDQSQHIPDSDRKHLIKDLGLKSRLLINFTWDDRSSAAARNSGANLLKPQLRSQAQDIQVPAVPVVEDDDNKKSALGKLGAASKGENGGQPSTTRKGGVTKWLKQPGKK